MVTSGDDEGGGKTQRSELTMSVVSMKALLESGVHFGHRTHRWHPMMSPYIFTERNGIHIINLQLTVKALTEIHGVIRDTVAAGGTVLFVGTKRQAQESVELEATRCGMPYVTARWLGGMLTNYRTIRERINELDQLERRRDGGELDHLTKKEALMISREIEKLLTRFSGTRHMAGLPDLLFAVDVRREETAIHEANLLNIPVVAMVDTNCDPRNIDYIIPSNDDAIRAIKLIVSKVADAVLEGKALRKEDEEEQAEAAAAEAPVVTDAELTDEDLLGEATLAKMREAEEEATAAAEAAVALAEAQAAEAAEAAEAEAGEAGEDDAEVAAEEETESAAEETEVVEAEAAEAVEAEEAAAEAEVETEPVAEETEVVEAEAVEVEEPEASVAADEADEDAADQAVDEQVEDQEEAEEESKEAGA
jgi:small subunit ribosomal protein S2